MLFRKIYLILILGVFGLALAACGDSDSESSDKAKTMDTISQDSKGQESMSQDSTSQDTMSNDMAAGDSDATLKAYDPDVPSMVVEDNNAVQQKEIYEKWPAENPVGDTDEATTVVVEEAPAAVAEATKHVVYAQATSFSPNILFINPGDTVQWENMTIHDSVSMEGLIPDGAKPWKFNIGQNGAVTLTEEGVYIYKCNPHYPNGMVAAIIVGKPVNIEQIQTNATGRSKGIVIKVVKALATR